MASSPTPRPHRSIKPQPSSIMVTVEAATQKTITLSAPEIGILKWPTSHFSGTLKKGDTIELRLGTPPKPKEKPDIQDLRILLQELVR